MEREKKQQEEAVKRAAELRAAALQRKQQEQQARQQQQHLLKMNKKKVQNAIKTQQRKVTVLKPALPSVTYKATVTPPVPPGVLRRTLPVVPLTASNKVSGIAVGIAPPVRTQSPARATFNTTASPHVQRLQPKPTVTQRVLPAQVPSSQISGSSVPGTALGQVLEMCSVVEVCLFDFCFDGYLIKRVALKKRFCLLWKCCGSQTHHLENLKEIMKQNSMQG